MIHLTRLNAFDGLLLADQTLFHHIDGHFDGCLGVALGRARLEHVEAAFFDGEFQVLHIAVMLFQAPGDFLELLVHFGQVLLQATDFGWSANTRDYVLALRVQQVFTIELLLARTGVACEGYARAAIVAHIAEDHALHVDSRAKVVRNLVEIAIVNGAFVIPGRENGLDGFVQLLVDICGEWLAGLFFGDLLEFGHDLLQVGGGNLRVAGNPGGFVYHDARELEAILDRLDADPAAAMRLGSEGQAATRQYSRPTASRRPARTISSPRFGRRVPMTMPRCGESSSD